MGFRIVIVQNKAKLSYKDGFLSIKTEDELKMIHLSEISMIFLETSMASITSYLLNEIISNKISLIICNDKHNPNGELIPYYSSYHSSKNILKQSKWDDVNKNKIWRLVVNDKIINQSNVLLKLENNNYMLLREYATNIVEGDLTNREGHAAKVYFNSCFGKNFSREDSSYINHCLDYGYSILLSAVNRAIVNCGYYTQIGINHRNEYNHYNFACDLMEPFRPIVDYLVISEFEKFDAYEKQELIKILNKEIIYENKKQYLINAIYEYVLNTIAAIENRSEYISFIYEI